MLTDAALCGPVTLALPQDVQTMAYDFPEDFFSPSAVLFGAAPPMEAELARAVAVLRESKRPLIVAGGGVLYARASEALRAFVEAHRVPVAETQAGKGALAWDDPLQLGAIGVTGSTAANALAHEADVVLAIGTRLQDFTTGSHSLATQARLVSLNVNLFDALKWRGMELRADARLGLEALSQAMPGWQSAGDWQAKATKVAKDWRTVVDSITGRREALLPYEGEVIGAVQRSAGPAANPRGPFL